MRLTRSVGMAASGLACATTLACAHGVADAGHHHLLWSFEPWVLASLAVSALWYTVGLARMQAEGVRGIIGGVRVTAFASGMVALFIALVSPIDTVGAELFSVHMVQHLLLMMVAAPLLVCSRPVLAFLWAFPSPVRKHIGRVWAAARLTRAFDMLMHPVVVWTAFSGLFVFWHIPAAYQWALRNEGVHTLEHLCFFVSALAFWTIVIEPSGRRRLGYGPTLLFVATTAVLSGLPGALMIFAPRPLYPMHAAGAAGWGLTLMQDQQLAGLLMWIPAGLMYVGAVAWLFLRWLEEAERSVSAAARQAALLPLLLLLLPPLLARCTDEVGQARASNVGGDPQRGAALMQRYGCGACHIVPGIEGAHGMVGPPLTSMGRRVYIAGLLRNSPDNMMAWLQDPQRFVPGNAMPTMGIDREDARDLTAYLFTLQ